MRAIHGGKSADDRIDSQEIAQLLRGGNLPIAYVYPKGLRETRDLLRRRMYLVHKRAEVVAHVVNTNSQYNLPPFGKKLIYARNRQALQIADRFADATVRKSIELNLRLLDALDDLIGDAELDLDRTVKVDDADTFYRLRSIPGVGKILALVLLYEIHDIHRFASEGMFLSYARLIRPLKTSAGRVKGSIRCQGQFLGRPATKDYVPTLPCKGTLCRRSLVRGEVHRGVCCSGETSDDPVGLLCRLRPHSL
jgi:transposase